MEGYIRDGDSHALPRGVFSQTGQATTAPKKSTGGAAQGAPKSSAHGTKQAGPSKQAAKKTMSKTSNVLGRESEVRRVHVSRAR